MSVLWFITDIYIEPRGGLHLGQEAKASFVDSEGRIESKACLDVSLTDKGRVAPQVTAQSLQSVASCEPQSTACDWR